MQQLLRKRVDELISILTMTGELKDHDINNTDIEVQIKNVETLAKDHVQKLREIASVLPDPNILENYVAQNQSKCFKNTGTQEDETQVMGRRSKSLSEKLGTKECSIGPRRGTVSMILGKDAVNI